MSKPKLYGISGSRALRSLWAIEECGIEYEHVPVTFRKDSKSPEYLAVNPNGRVPALKDGDLIVFESLAINLYLAKQYGGGLYPDNVQDEARAVQWSIWVIAEMEDLQLQLVIQKIFTKEEDRDPQVWEDVSKKLARPLKVLDDALAEKQWLVGDEFSIADLNVAAAMLLMPMVGFDYSQFQNVSQWAERCYARPALERAKARD
ncbi:MAG: glutathione S-transferase family protein [Gammaproteobacteria bacterium]